MASLAEFGNRLYTGEKSYPIVPRRRLWFTIAFAGVLLSALVVGFKGLNPGIEFRGGSEFTISGTADTSADAARALMTGAGVTDVRVTTVGSSAVRIQTESLEAGQVESLRGQLADAYGVQADSVTSTFVGPAWGADVTSKALQGLVIFLVLVSIVMMVYFRSWRMSAAAITALLHDVIVTVGVYALIGFEVTPATVIGFLTILGYSLYDTVVVFDKVRENTAGVTDQGLVTYAEQANLAVNQTLVRSINTSIVGILPVASILFVGSLLLGAGTLRDIALALMIGMLISTVSSIFIATPLEVALREREAGVAAHTGRVLAGREDLGTEEAASLKAGSVARAQPGGHSGIAAGSHQGQAAQPKRKKRSQR